MATNEQLAALMQGMVETQHALIFAAAEADALPADKQLTRIADLETAIRAIEELLDARTGPVGAVLGR